MLKRVATIFFAVVYHASSGAWASDMTKTGISLDSEWKRALYAYAEMNVRHSIWGTAHSERNYQVAIQLASNERLQVDKDVLFAAAFLHDIGAIEAFRLKGVEHAARSVQVAEPLLRSYGLPDAKITKIREAILAHMYDADWAPKSPEAVVFHDADALDFLGSIGLVRIVGLTDRHGWAPNLVGAIQTLGGWTKELPKKLVTRSAKKLAEKRITELNKIIDSIKLETFSGAVL